MDKQDYVAIGFWAIVIILLIAISCSGIKCVCNKTSSVISEYREYTQKKELSNFSAEKKKLIAEKKILEAEKKALAKEKKTFSKKQKEQKTVVVKKKAYVHESTNGYTTKQSWILLALAGITIALFFGRCGYHPYVWFTMLMIDIILCLIVWSW